MNEAEQQVLQMISEGVISADEGDQLLQAMGTDEIVPESVTPANPVAFPPPPAWADHWLVIVLVGAVLMFVGLGFTFLVIGGTISGWWLLLTLSLLVAGSLVILLGYFCSSQRWLHVRVESPDANFKFNLPLPLTWIVSVFKVARFFEPKLAVVTDDVLELVYGSEGFFYVEVDDADKDEYVQIYYS